MIRAQDQGRVDGKLHPLRQEVGTYPKKKRKLVLAKRRSKFICLGAKKKLNLNFRLENLERENTKIYEISW
jgi:hypothetical protein